MKQHEIPGAVMRYYLDTGKPCTVRELAAYAGTSQGTIRAAMDSPDGFVDWTHKQVRVVERNYGTATFRDVRALVPSRLALRHLIHEIRAAIRNTNTQTED